MEEILGKKFENPIGDNTVFLTKAKKSSTSSEAIGASLSVLEYHGGLVNWVLLEMSACGFSWRVLFLNR